MVKTEAQLTPNNHTPSQQPIIDHNIVSMSNKRTKYGRSRELDRIISHMNYSYITVLHASTIHRFPPLFLAVISCRRW